MWLLLYHCLLAEISLLLRVLWLNLRRAATAGHVEVMRLLLDHGCDADIDVQDTADGLTPLMRAAQGGHTEAVRLLLGSDKVDVNRLELEDSGAQVSLGCRRRTCCCRSISMSIL